MSRYPFSPTLDAGRGLFVLVVALGVSAGVASLGLIFLATGATGYVADFLQIATGLAGVCCLVVMSLLILIGANSTLIDGTVSYLQDRLVIFNREGVYVFEEGREPFLVPSIPSRANHHRSSVQHWDGFVPEIQVIKSNGN